jgi:hypothetical protein
MLAGYPGRYAAWGLQLMERWLFNLVAAVSLLLSLAAAAAWAMSLSGSPSTDAAAVDA